MTKSTVQEHARNVAPLDALRGLAAFMVVLGHSRGVLLAAQGTPQSGEGWQKVAFLPTSYAKESVAVFFVLSGYLVGGQVLRTVSGHRFTWRGYVARRFSRLYAVLLPALALTIGVDSVVRHLDPNGAKSVGASPFRPSQLVCNLAFLQDARCEPLGSNSSLWSLGYELWFYILFAALTVALFSAAQRRLRVALINGAVAVGCLLAFGIHLLWLFPAWLIGVGLAAWQRRRPPTEASTGAIMVSSALLVSVATVSTVTSMPQGASFIVVGLATVPLIHSMTSSSPVWETSPVTQLARLGGWSYTLYAFHRPLITVAAAGLTTRGEPMEGVTAVVAVYAIGIIIAAFSYPAYFAGEAYTARIRRLLLPKSSTSSAAPHEPMNATNG